MAPRFTLLIIVGIVVYVSLSLYHWRQVKKIPTADNKHPVHAMLSRESREKNWVQVSTASNLTGESAKKPDSRESKAQTGHNSTQPAAPSTNSLPETTQSSKNKTDNPPSSELQSFRNENRKLRETLQHEQSITQRQAREINELHAQLSALDATAATAKESTTEKNRIHNLTTFLTAKTDALAKANARITGLADKLEQSGRTLAETEDSNAYLRNLLANSENAEARARQRADQLNARLIQTSKERETYLAETGRLDAQLRQEKSRLAQMENELNKARLTSEAMLRYGKVQTELITPFRQQIEITSARIEDKKSALLTAEEEITQLRDREVLLQNRIQSLQLELHKNMVAREKLDATTQALGRAQQHSSELTGQLKVLADQLNARDALIYTLRQNLANAKTTAQDAAQQFKILQKETEQQLQKLETTRQKLTAGKQQLDASMKRQQNLEAQLSEIRQTNEQLGRKTAEQEKLLETARAEIAQLTASLRETDKRQIAAEEALQSSQAALQELKTIHRTTVQTNRSDMDKTISHLRSTLETTQSRLTETEARQQILEKSLAEAEIRAEKTTDSAVTRLQREKDQLKKSLVDQEQQQKNLKRTLAELKNENRLLLEKISVAEQDDQNSAELESGLEQKNMELNQKKERLVILENQRDALRSELDRQETAFAEMREKFTSLRKRVDSLQKERDTFFPYTLDSDNDTISDARDSCPDTVQGVEVGANGCEPDSDHDGIVDRLDLCLDAPGKAGTNRFGCTRGEHILLSGIFFSGGNAELSPAAQSYLDKVAGVLKLSSDSRFEVAGHTDSIGEPARNLTVSRQRAEAVTDYLVNKGIKAGRLVPVGHGAEQPVADNGTPKGRAANRRVELKIILPDPNAPSNEDEEPVTTLEEGGLPAR